MTASKDKGTGGEREFRRELEGYGLDVIKREAGAKTDLQVRGAVGEPRSALATRPDHGKWLVTVDLPTFVELLKMTTHTFDIEVKRWARFAHHTVWTSKGL